MDNKVYVVIDKERDCSAAICSDYDTAYDMATKHVKSNTPYETLEECEDVWIEEIELNTWLW